MGGQYVLKDIVFTDTVRFVVLVGDAVKDKFLDRVTEDVYKRQVYVLRMNWKGKFVKEETNFKELNAG